MRLLWLFGVWPAAWLLCWPSLAVWATRGSGDVRTAWLYGVFLGPIGVVVLSRRTRAKRPHVAGPKRLCVLAAGGAVGMLLFSLFPWLSLAGSRASGIVSPSDLGPLLLLVLVLAVAVVASTVACAQGETRFMPLAMICSTALWTTASTLAIAAAFAGNVAGIIGHFGRSFGAGSAGTTIWCWAGWLSATTSVVACALLSIGSAPAGSDRPSVQPVVVPTESEEEVDVWDAL